MKKNALILLLLALCLLFSSAAADKPVQTEGIVIPVIEDLKQFDIPDNEAMAFVRGMNVGWNLGNTFDSYDDEGWFHGAEPGMETAWGNPVTTPELLDALAEAGISTLRLPVSWHNHVDADHRINAVWLDRVRQVVDEALARGLYVIVNIHHDNNKNAFYPDEAHFESSCAYLTDIWQQLAEAFADCGDHLILEALNEPRLVGTKWEWAWDVGNAECREAADCINRFNQLFVDTVRAAGGNNANRFLMITGYCASPWNITHELFQMPQDTVENRLIIEAHAYTPYPFALEPGSGDRTFTLDDSAKKSEIGNFLNKLYARFVSKGIPVVMDEFGAVNRNENLQDRVNFTAWYVASAAARGIPCIWWDNGLFNGAGELFGIMDRKNAQWVYPDIVLAMTENAMKK